MANSFQLIRTNPRISGNIKITVDSEGRVWLNTIDANKQLADSRFKKFRVGAGSYAIDLRRFVSTLPPDVLFAVHNDVDPLTISKSFKGQYDFFYNAGASLMVSSFYDEPYSYFAPLWLDDRLPNYFVIFRVDDPLDYPYTLGVSSISAGKKYKVSADTSPFIVKYENVNYQDGDTITGNIDTSWTVVTGSGRLVLLDENKDFPVNGSDQFRKMLRKSSVVATFDLSEKTTIGKYIRSISASTPLAPLSVRMDQGLMTTWNGVSYKDGVFTAKGELLDSYWQTGQTQIGFDDYITGGFQRHGIVCTNLLNLEFLFEDKFAEEYSIPRYFGLYCDAIDTGTFQLDGETSFRLRNISGNTPIPPRSNRGYRDQGENWYQNNQNGVVLYTMNRTGLVPASIDIDSTDRLWCIRNKDGEFISLDMNTPFGLDPNALDVRVRDKQINLGRLAGAGRVLFQAPGELLPQAGRSYAIFGLNDQLQPLDEIRIYWHGGQTGTDAHGPYDAIVANDLTGIEPDWGPGSHLQWYYFHPYGTSEEVLDGITGAINALVGRSFDAIRIGKEIVIRFRGTGAADNAARLKFYVMYSNDITIYGQTLTPAAETLYHPFQGGTDSAKIRLKFPLELTDKINAQETWIKTRLGLSRVTFVGRFVDAGIEEVGGDTLVDLFEFDTHGVLTIDDPLDDIIIGSTGDFTAYALYDVPVSVLSFFPVKAIDGDFLSSTYTRTPTNEYHRYLDVMNGDLVEGRQYMIMCDNFTDTAAVYDETGTLVGNYTNGTTFTPTAPGWSFVKSTANVFVVPKLYYGQAIPPDMDLLIAGETYYVLGDSADAIEYVSGTITANPGGPITSFVANPTLLRYQVSNGHPVVVRAFSKLDPDLASFSGFWTLHDIVGVNADSGINPDSIKFTHYDKFFSNLIASEYDYLKENYLKEYASYSRTFPSVSKWAYKNGTDIRDNPYRLNAHQVFGQLNFSPSFKIKRQVPGGFTHEWYYLEMGPAEMNSAFAKDNYYYFGQPIDVAQLIDADPNIDDYFQDYFTVQPAPNTAVQERFVEVNYNSETGFAECFFRGAKISFKEVQQDTKVERLKQTKPPFVAGSRRFAEYRFTAMLRAVPEDKCSIQPPVSIRFIENKTTRTVTLLIDVVMDDYRAYALVPPDSLATPGSPGPFVPEVCPDVYTTSYTPSALFWNDYPDSIDTLSPSIPNRNLDYMTLYSLRDKKTEGLYTIGGFVFGTDATLLGDVKLSTSLKFGFPSGNYGGRRRVFAYPTLDYDLDLRDQVKSVAKSNTMKGYYRYGYFHLPAPLGVSKDYIEFGFPGLQPYGLYANPLPGWNGYGAYFPYEQMTTTTTTGITATFGPPSGGDWNWKDFPAWVEYGGTGYWESIMNRLSFAYIAEKINEYSRYISWESYTWDGSNTVMTEDEFYVDLVPPSTIYKTTALVPQVDDDKPSELTSEPVIGVNAITVPVIAEMQRYSGPYEPKFTDVIFFKDQKTDTMHASPDLDLSFQRATFDPDNTDFGVIDNHGYIKVSQTDILALSNNTKYKSLYPLVHESAIDYRDLLVFQSSWDPGYWREFINRQSFAPVAGTREMTEVKNYFGTKIMKTPDFVRAQQFIVQQIAGPDVDPLSVDAELLWYTTGPKVTIIANIGKRLTRAFIEDGASSAFVRYMMPEFGVGDPTDILSDVTAYLTTNVVPAFAVSASDIYLRQYTENLNLDIVRGDLTDAQKLQNGYKVEKNVTTKNLGGLIYTTEFTPKTGSFVSIAPSFTITRI